MKINLIISTYSGCYSKNDKSKYLRYNLLLLNSIKTNIDQISIMVPDVEKNHIKIDDYYDISKLDLINIKDKIKFFKCKNIGISYGQFFTCLSNNRDFDYHIFIEDDYICFKNYFENDLINNINKYTNTLICSFIYKDRYWDIIKYTEEIGEEESNIMHIKKYFKNLNCIIPDFSLSIISKQIVDNIFKIYTIENILDMFNCKFKHIWIHQIIFGYILNMCNIKIEDISNEYMNIFYHSENKAITICNNDDNNKSYVHNWKELDKNIKFKDPIFIPIEVILYNYDNDIKLMGKYLYNDIYFLNILTKFKNILLY